MNIEQVNEVVERLEAPMPQWLLDKCHKQYRYDAEGAINAYRAWLLYREVPDPRYDPDADRSEW